MANNELFRTESIRHPKGGKMLVGGAKVRHDVPVNRVYLWLILLAGIGGGLLIILIIIHLIIYYQTIV